MNLTIYNVLSHLIPGFLVYAVLVYTFGIDNKDVAELQAVALAYGIGFFVNSIAAWLEGFYFWTWGGMPSSQILEGQACGRIKFSEWKTVKGLLQKELGKHKGDSIKLFGVAMRVAKNEGRIDEMNAQYAFARAMLTGVIVASIVFLVNTPCNLWLWPTAVIFSLVTWYRAKERGYYYAKEVLSVALNQLK